VIHHLHVIKRQTPALTKRNDLDPARGTMVSFLVGMGLWVGSYIAAALLFG